MEKKKKLELQKDGTVEEIYGLTRDDMVRIATFIQKIFGARHVNFSSIIEEAYDMFEDEKKRAFTIFSAGRAVGMIEILRTDIEYV